MSVRELPCVPLRDRVLLPDTQATLYVSRPASLGALAAAGPGGELFVVLQKNADTVEPTHADLHDVGTVSILARQEESADATVKATVRGAARAGLRSTRMAGDVLFATIELLSDKDSHAEATRALAAEVIEAIARLHARSMELQGLLLTLGLRPTFVSDIETILSMGDPAVLANLGAEACLETAERLALLRCDEVADRLRRVKHGAQTRTITDQELTARWLENTKRTAERLLGEAKMLDVALRSPDARRPMAPVEQAASVLASTARAQRARLRGSRPPTDS